MKQVMPFAWMGLALTLIPEVKVKIRELHIHMDDHMETYNFHAGKCGYCPTWNQRMIPRWRLVLKRRKAMTKKNENNSGSLVLVDAELLSQGLKTAFTGIAMVFDSLGASGAADEIKAAQETSPSPTISAASQVSSETKKKRKWKHSLLTRSRKRRTSLQSLPADKLTPASIGHNR